MSLEEFVENLTKEDIELINLEFAKKENKTQVFSFSRITITDLKKLVEIKRVRDRQIFDSWFNNSIKISKQDEDFLNSLLDNFGDVLAIYREEKLKAKFIIPILNRIDFVTDEIEDFYDEKLTYESKNFIFNGETDFMVAKGLEIAEIPYFFIQEFKRNEESKSPRPQLLAELISAVELNNEKIMKGAYIIGENWNFVILERLAKHKYQYFISKTFNSTNIEDLKGIYKNLLFIKNEIIEKIKNEK